MALHQIFQPPLLLDDSAVQLHIEGDPAQAQVFNGQHDGGRGIAAENNFIPALPQMAEDLRAQVLLVAGLPSLHKNGGELFRLSGKPGRIPVPGRRPLKGRCQLAFLPQLVEKVDAVGRRNIGVIENSHWAFAPLMIFSMDSISPTSVRAVRGAGCCQGTPPSTAFICCASTSAPS